MEHTTELINEYMKELQEEIDKNTAEEQKMKLVEDEHDTRI